MAGNLSFSHVLPVSWITASLDVICSKEKHLRHRRIVLDLFALAFSSGMSVVQIGNGGVRGAYFNCTEPA